MNDFLPIASIRRRKVLLPVLVGGTVAGALDLTSAFMTFGWGVPRGIASGLLGAKALHGGLATWALGVVLHFSIACTAALASTALTARSTSSSSSPTTTVTDGGPDWAAVAAESARAAAGLMLAACHDPAGKHQAARTRAQPVIGSPPRQTRTGFMP